MKHRIEMELDAMPSEVMAVVNEWVRVAKNGHINAEFISYKSIDPQAQVILATGVSSLGITGL